MDIIEIAKLIEENGGILYLVGGAVRDSLLGKKITDKDYVITGLDKYTFLKLFPDSMQRGKSFEVFDINEKEFALARCEIKTGLGHKGFETKTGKEITIEEDLKRRDITINAIAENVLTKQVVDPFNGRVDIENKIIRNVTESFKEDPLRVYRVARFAAVLEFEVSEETIELMYELKSELETISKERIFEEFKKALSSNKPSIFFDVLRKAKVLDVHFKEIFNLIGSEQSEIYHSEGDSYNHTMQVLDLTAKYTQDLSIRFAGLVHDLGKGITPKEEYPHHYGHDNKGVKLVEDLRNRIEIPKAWIKCGKTASNEHMIGGIFGKMTVSKKVQFIERVGKSRLGLEGLQIIVRADRRGRGNLKESEDEIKMSAFQEIGKKCLNEINGEYIIKKYGEINGERFKQLLHHERIEWMKKYINNIDKERLKAVL